MIHNIIMLTTDYLDVFIVDSTLYNLNSKVEQKKLRCLDCRNYNNKISGEIWNGRFNYYNSFWKILVIEVQVTTITYTI